MKRIFRCTRELPLHKQISEEDKGLIIEIII